MRAVRFSSLAVAAALLASAVGAQSIRSAPPAAYPLRIGALEAWSLRDGQGDFPNDGKTFGLGVPPSDVAKVLAAAGAPTDDITVGVDALLVKSPGRMMLFDAGLGPKFHASLMGSLALAHVAPEMVTDVFITHAHGDHVGGLLDASGASAFPKAVIHISAPEWAWLRTQPNIGALVRVVAPQVRTFALGSPVAPGVVSLPIAGHTPGHTGYLITSGDQTLIDMGDAAHSSIVSLARPDWKIEFDTDRNLGARSRHDEIAILAATHARLFAPHFPYPGVGTIETGPDGYRWAPEATPR